MPGIVTDATLAMFCKILITCELVTAVESGERLYANQPISTYFHHSLWVWELLRSQRMSHIKRGHWRSLTAHREVLTWLKNF